MSSPAKRRKLNGPKALPTSSRNLDFFFGKKKDLPKDSGDSAIPTTEDSGDSDLTDEQLARKLQAEWNNEDDPQGSGLPLQSSPDVDQKSVETKLSPDIEISELQENLPVLWEESGELDKIYGEVNVEAAKPNNTLSLQSAGNADDTISSTVPFDESPLTFEPSRYVSALQKHWVGEGGDASYALLTRCFVLINSTQSRIRIVDTLVNLLRTIIEGDPSSLLPTVRNVPNITSRHMLCISAIHS